MNQAWSSESERRNLDVEVLTRARDHLIAPFHLADIGGQGTTRGVLEALTGFENRLLANDSGALDLFDLAIAVGDDPVAREELNRLLAQILDGDRVEKEPVPRLRLGTVRVELWLDPDPDAACCGFGREI
jgi:hypothetical protein